MPESIRALLVILALATAVFAFAKTPACAVASAEVDFSYRRNLWYAVALVVFLANSFWIYVCIVAILLSFASIRESNKIALFFCLLFAAPSNAADISGLGIINYFFTLSYPRLLSLTILVPAYLYLRRQPE